MTQVKYSYTFEDKYLANLLDTIDFGNLALLDDLAQKLFASLLPIVGGQFRIFASYICPDDPFYNVDAVIENSTFENLNYDILEIRCNISRDRNNLRVTAFCMFFLNGEMTTPFPPHHNAVIELNLRQNYSHYCWSGDWVFGDGPGEWEGPPSHSKYATWQRFWIRDGDFHPITMPLNI